MKVREFMSSPVHTCRPQDSLAQAAKLMWDHDCGMLPVVDAQGRVGSAITDRDICMSAFTRGRPLAELRVADAMSKDVVSCRVDDDLGAAVERMAQRQLHRLPVVDAEGKPCGILSLNDLALGSEQDGRITKETLVALRGACRHRTRVPAVTPAAPDKVQSSAGRPASAKA